MKPKTLVLMVVAVACGLAASYMTSRLLAERSTKEAASEEKVKILVAKKNLTMGTLLKNPEDLFEERLYTKGEEPKKALRSFDQVKDRRLNKSVQAEQWLAIEDLFDKERGGMSNSIPAGMRAFGVKVNAESTGGGFVLPNSRVDVVWVARRGDSESTAKIILQNVLVLAVDTQEIRPDDKNALIPSTVTLAVTPEQSERLSLAGEMGSLKLVLRGFGDEAQVRTTGVKPNTIAKGGENADPNGANGDDAGMEKGGVWGPKSKVDVPPTPKQADPPPVAVVEKAPEAPPPPKTHTLTIYNGEQVTKNVFVLNDKDEAQDVKVEKSQPDRAPAAQHKPVAPAIPVLPPALVTPPAAEKGDK